MANYASFRNVIEHTVQQRRDFFRLVFGEETGFVCITYISHLSKKAGEYYYEYPVHLNRMCKDIDDNCQNLIHAYFGINLLENPKRNRDESNIVKSTVAWCDLDTCSPLLMQVDPSIVIQTSRARWQALWRFEETQPVEVAEDISRKIAYFHSDQGSDKGCWNRSRILRIPYTPNYKYGDINTAPVVIVTATSPSLYRPSDFKVYPEIEVFKTFKIELPHAENLPDEDPEEILKRYSKSLPVDIFGRIRDIPNREEDWSEILWSIEKWFAEAGLTQEEAFKVLWNAGCNKYKRDGRPQEDLWIEIRKAYLEVLQERDLIPTPTAKIPEIISEEEIKEAQLRETFVERYIKYASGVTDAAVQYHQASAFIILSSIISSNVYLPTSFGTIKPNLWFYICGDSTVTRKTTAMKIGNRLLQEVDSDAIFATDGSPEGIITALSSRPKRASVYHKDEFTGLLDSMIHKEYMSGMAEMFTKLYDGDDLKRILRREEIRVTDPVFIMFVGGPKTKTQLTITEEMISSGFIPRFVFITANPDIQNVRPVGPPIQEDYEARESLLNELHVINKRYNEPVIFSGIGKNAPSFEVKLTREAWIRYNQLETILTSNALESGLLHLTPVYDRLAKSTLKSAVLIAASRTLNGSVTVELADLIHAIYYCRNWFKYASEIVNNVGKTNDERMIDSLMNMISDTGDLGIPRSELMRVFHLDSKRADLLFTTMEQRGLIRRLSWRKEYRYVDNMR